MSEFKFAADLTQWFDLCDSMINLPLDRISRLEDVIQHAFQDTQQRVHVITGSLRGSGSMDTDFDGSIWWGSVSYGGASPGFPKNPVTYAEIERARGGDHDFFSGMDQFQDEIEDAMVGWI